MPRVKRKVETFVSPVLLELEETLARLDLTLLAQPGMTVAKIEADRAKWSSKWQRRVDKAIARWHSMTIADRKAWTDEYATKAKLPKAGDIPLLFAVVSLAERDTAKAEKRRAKRPPSDPHAVHRAPVERGHAPGRRPPPAEAAKTLASPEPSTPPRSRGPRRGPAYGVVGYQVDGVFHRYGEGDSDD